MNTPSRLIVPPLDEEPWPSLGFEVIDYIESSLCFGPGDLLGEPARLTDELKLFIVRAYEVFPRGATNERGDDISGRRRFKRCALFRRKGVGKTEIAAWISIAELDPEAPVRCDGWRVDRGEWVPVGRGIHDAYVPMVAYTEEQTEELAYGAAYNIVQRCAIADRFNPTLEQIGLHDAPGKITALASSPSARDGARTTFQNFDEPHLYVTERLKKAHSTMQRNIPKRYAADAWSLYTTTMYGPGEESVAEDIHQLALAVAQGRTKADTLYFDHRQAAEHHDIASNKGLRAAIEEASGDAFAFTDVDAVISLFRDPAEDENENRRYWLNQPRRSSRRWGLAPMWAPLAEVGFKPADGVDIVLGFDGSYTRDCTAIVGCTVEETPHLFLVNVWERPPGNRAWRVPRLEVLDAVAGAMERWNVLELAPDPPGWVSEIEGWEETYGDVVVRFDTNQPRRMGPACDDFEQAVRDARLRHDGAEVIARHLANCVPITRGSFTWVQKDPNLPEDKVDAAVAAIVAHHRALYHLAHQQEYVDFMVIDPTERRSG